MSGVRTFSSTASCVDPYERGRELGATCAEQVRATLGRYRELWGVFGVAEDDVRRVGTAVLDPIRGYAPDLSEEIRGIAAGAGLAHWEIGALNARTELLALGQGLMEECTTGVLVPDDSPPLTVQTWDWYDNLVDSWFVWTLPRSGGGSVHTLTEYGIVGKIGVSSAGVSVHFNALRHRRDRGDGGVPVHVVARRVLDEAESVDEAVRIAAAAEVSASSSVTVTGPRGDGNGEGWDTLSIELHPGGPAVVSRALGAMSLVHTNHFVAAEVDEADQVRRPLSTTYERFDLATTSLTNGRPPNRDDLAAALASHELGPHGTCAHPLPGAPLDERGATLAVVVTEPAAGRMWVHAGGACTAGPHQWAEFGGSRVAVSGASEPAFD